MPNHLLVSQLARNVDQAFPAFVDATQHRLYGGLRMLVGQDADDVAQETYLRAYRALTNYPPDRIQSLEVGPWLWTIALNASRNSRRTSTRRPVVLLDRVPDEPVSQPTPFDDELGAAVRSLPTAQRVAVVLRHILGFSYAEIAIITGRAVGTVKSDASRGLGSLRKKGLQE